MATYILFKSDSNNSLTFAPSEGANLIIDQDSREIWRVEAPTWEIACLKKNEFLSWEPYKPQINSADDLLTFLPRNKHDFDNVQLLINLGFPTIQPIIPKLLEWLQDVNWPVARAILPFLATIGSNCRDDVQTVLRSHDGIWKYWIISELINRMDDNEALMYVPDLRNLMANLTPDDRENEVDLAALAILKKLNIS